MKKIYLEPQTEAMEIESTTMMCTSTGVDDTPAGGAALAPYRDDDWDEEE